MRAVVVVRVENDGDDDVRVDGVGVHVVMLMVLLSFMSSPSAARRETDAKQEGGLSLIHI